MRGGADSPGLKTTEHTSNRVTGPQQWDPADEHTVILGDGAGSSDERAVLGIKNLPGDYLHQIPYVTAECIVR